MSRDTSVFTMRGIPACPCADKDGPVGRKSDDAEERGASAGAMTLSGGGGDPALRWRGCPAADGRHGPHVPRSRREAVSVESVCGQVDGYGCGNVFSQ